MGERGCSTARGSGNMNSPTPYPQLSFVLQQFVAGVRVALGDSFLGAYLQGSFAVGDFDQHSDVDFIVAVSDEPSERRVRALGELHERIYRLDSPWAQHLEGSYFPAALLRTTEERGKPLWYLDHGSRSLERSTHCNTTLVRWVLREHGVALAGPSPATLVDPITVAALRREIGDTIRTWGQDILERPERYRNRYYQGFIVLNYSRMLHDLVAGCPGSKKAGAAWAKTTLDPCWRPLIDRAWGCRPNPVFAVREPADPPDFESTLLFVKYIMREAERYAACHG